MPILEAWHVEIRALPERMQDYAMRIRAGYRPQKPWAIEFARIIARKLQNPSSEEGREAAEVRHALESDLRRATEDAGTARATLKRVDAERQPDLEEFERKVKIYRDWDASGQNGPEPDWPETLEARLEDESYGRVVAQVEHKENIVRSLQREIDAERPRLLEMPTAVGPLARAAHGYSGTRIYKIWANIVQRCTNENNPDYPVYKGRLCDSWRVFENFLADVGEPPSTAHSLDRIDNNGNYEPGNCRWATAKRQARNRRRA